MPNARDVYMKSLPCRTFKLLRRLFQRSTAEADMRATRDGRSTANFKICSGAWLADRM
jgi:sulfopyruvate decarboxylase TPP-binding subunit